MKNDTFTIEPIAICHSPFKEKFAIPRQPRLVPEAIGRLQMLPPYDDPSLVRDLEQFSHLWLMFMFHQNLEKGWTPTIRPPRLGGNKRVGVLASRATFRPNGMGMSAVALKGVETTGDKVEVIVSGIDLLDGTPIVDIKPYIPYSDAIDDATGGFADDAPEAGMSVAFSLQARQQCQQFTDRYPDLAVLIEKLLAQDPRPAYRKKDSGEQSYGVRLYDFNVTWQVTGGQTTVTDITPA